jgi:hypothetical protein
LFFSFRFDLTYFLVNLFKNESDALLQVLSYNEQCLCEDDNHVQTEFIKGTLMYKKLNKPIDAYHKLIKFVKLASGSHNYSLLRIKSKKLSQKNS